MEARLLSTLLYPAVLPLMLLATRLLQPRLAYSSTPPHISARISLVVPKWINFAGARRSSFIR